MASIFDSDAPQKGQRGTEKAHRKVELQSPDDLTYLISAVSQSARTKIDRHLPPDATPTGDDALRQRVEQLLDDYIRNTFSAAKDSMSINGMDSGELETELAKAQEGEEIEPFDAKLAQRVQALSAQIEGQTLDLASLRRQAPAETAGKWREGWDKEAVRWEERFRVEGKTREREAGETRLDVGEVERLEEVQGTWQSGTEALTALKSGLGGTVAKMERARQAADYVEGKE